MKIRLVLMAVCLMTMALAGGARADQSPLDQGAADSVLIRVTQSPNASLGQYQLTAEMHFLNDIQRWNGTALGFKWVSTALVMDSARLSPEAQSSFDFSPFFFRNNKIDSTNKYDVFQLTLSRIAGTGWAPRTTPAPACTFYFHVTSWSDMDEVVFDTVKVLGANNTVVDEALAEYKPTWNGPITVYDPNRPAISNLVLSGDTLFFQSVQGQGSPAPQEFTITSDNLPLVFGLTESASWLLKSPVSGTTPATIEVSVTPTGLTPGVRFDSIMVSSTGADNSPQYLYVRYTLLPPPPEIGVNPSSFSFSAVAGGANPSPQTLTLSNLGGGNLNWSVSNTQSWLQLDPLSGSGGGTVTLTVDITGLSYGVFDDVVTVSDPAASNHPVEVPVQLIIASDLPSFEVDEQVMYLPVPASWSNIFIRTFEVRNGGGGVLSFSTTSEDPNGLEMADATPDDPALIMFVSPANGTAPATITVQFKFEQWAEAYAIDTVWLISPDATNSPFPVIFHQRVVPYPAELALSQDTVDLAVYECSQGYDNSLPQMDFTVTNTGGDNPMLVEYFYDSELFRVLPDVPSGEPAPATFTIEGLQTALPVGSYFDSLKISARWAINKPVWLYVRYEVLGGMEPPEILTVPGALSVAWQEDSGPTAADGFEVWNVYGGCMSWSLQESESWLSVASASGVVPGTCSFLLDPTGFTLGTYNGSVSVVASAAINSPLVVPVELRVWKLHGDWNWNGRITMQDISEMTHYVFGVGSPAQPAPEVGDCTCDGNLTVADIAAVIDYLFISLEPVCGNPY